MNNTDSLTRARVASLLRRDLIDKAMSVALNGNMGCKEFNSLAERFVCKNKTYTIVYKNKIYTI